jgi:hypothetical protein
MTTLFFNHTLIECLARLVDIQKGSRARHAEKFWVSTRVTQSFIRIVPKNAESRLVPAR